MGMEGMVWLPARVLVRHSGSTSTAAVESLPTRQHVVPLSTQPFSSKLAQEPIAMLLMMAQALSLARLMNIPLFSVLTIMGKNTEKAF